MDLPPIILPNTHLCSHLFRRYIGSGGGTIQNSGSMGWQHTEKWDMVGREEQWQQKRDVVGGK